ncbi:MAG TPA: hypothetical protein VFV08_04010 [Puia sp.]|nr:hypothetical protein [Puia sp.]
MKQFLLLLLAFPLHSYSQKKFDFNSNCQSAYNDIIHLKLTTGQSLIDKEKKSNPENLIPYFLENYIDFFILFFNEDPAEYKTRKDNEERRIQLMKEGPAGSPYYLFTRSIIYFQWAAVHIKFSNYWLSAWDFHRSYMLGNHAEAEFPAFTPAKMLDGSMQVAAGTIPGGYKWLSNLLGIHGSIREGMKELEDFINQTDPDATLFHNEAIFYFLYLKFYIQNEREGVFSFIQRQQLDTRNNLLFAYLATNLAINSQQAALAEKIISEKNNSPEYFTSVVWDLEMGYAKMDHLDPEGAAYLQKFIEEFKGRFYVKDALQKLSWFYFLNGEMGKANEYRQLILKKGSLDTEADKQAYNEAKSGKWPNPLLLKARMLNDGGYFMEALQLLDGKSSSDFNLPEEKVEFAYRLGRIYDDLGRKDEALAAYLTTIKIGQQRKEYYAARAALQIGYIYEKKMEKQTAISYFQKVLDLKDHEYKNALDQKAKAGIARCKNE